MLIFQRNGSFPLSDPSDFKMAVVLSNNHKQLDIYFHSCTSLRFCPLMFLTIFNNNFLTQDGENRLDKEEYLVTLKKRLEEMLVENRMLKSELTDAQTNLALMKSQMSTVKHQLEEKNYELEL